MKILQRNKKIVIVLVSLIAVLAVGWLGYTWYKSATVNYAEEVARPIEEALVRAGAKKVCSTGDTGRGSDNRAPNYGAVFETDLARHKAIDMINYASSIYGYKLNEAASAYPNILPYYDHASHQNAYSDLRSGSVLLGISLYDGGTSLGCPDVKITYNSNHTAIKLDVSLPEYK